MKFVSKFAQELLHLGFRSLVQTLGMTTCIVQERISILIFIIPCIYSFFFFCNKIFHQNFSRATSSRILKFCINIGYDFCIVLERISILMLIISFICPFFFFSNINFSSQISQLLLESQSLQILYTLTED